MAIPPRVRRLLLQLAAELVRAAIEPTLRKKLPAVFAVADAKLRHAYKQGDDGQTVAEMIRQSAFEVTRKRASTEDLAGLIALFDPTRLPGR